MKTRLLLRIRRALLGLMIPAALIAQERPNALTSAEASEGWQLLFDGKTLTGWEQRPTSAAPANGDWTVESGALVCPGTSAGWIATAASYTDFRLRLEFRGGEQVNSGVFLRSQKEGQPHITGYELQIWDFQPAGFNTGSLVGTAKAAMTKIIPGAWNQYDIRAEGDHYTIVLDGKTVLDTRDSKHLSGVIGFQCQKNNRIEFRSIRLLPLRN